MLTANPFKRGMSITTKLLLLVLVVCLSFVFITTLVLLSLNQVRDLSTDVATTQMSRVVNNAQAARDLSQLFGDVHQLSLSLDEDTSEYQQTGRWLNERIRLLAVKADSPPFTQELETLGELLADLVRHYQDINALFSRISTVEVQTNAAFTRFVQQAEDRLIDAHFEDRAAAVNAQLLPLFSGLREGLVRIESRHSDLRSAFLAQRQAEPEPSAVAVIDELLMDMKALMVITPELADFSRQFERQLRLYRDASDALQQRIEALSMSRAGLAAQEQRLLAIIETTDDRTSRTTQALAADLDSIITSSGITILVLTVSVMVVMAVTISIIIRSNINQPIKRIIEGIEHFSQGKLLKRISLRGDDEWDTIGNALNKMANDLFLTYSELKDSEDKFYQVFENELNALLIFDKNSGQCLDANRVALDLYGVALDEIKGIRLKDLEQHLDEADGELDGEGWIRGSHRRKDGSVFPVEVHTGSFQRQGTHYLFTSVRDMTEQQRLQSQQLKTLSLLEATLESTSEGVLALATDGSVINYNQRFVELFKIPESRIAGAHRGQLLPQIVRTLRDSHNFVTMVRQSEQRSESTTSDKLHLKDGRVFECHSHPQMLDGKSVGRVWNFRDVSEYFKVMQELREKENRLAHLAHHDPLTGLANRLLFVDRLEQAIRKAKRTGDRLALFFIDLDRFKSINDSLGHMVGDILLQSFAERLTSTIRQMDTIARLGGDEFTLILDSVDSAQDAAKVAQKILDTLKEPFTANEHQFYVTSSIGISFYPDDGVDAETLLRNADAAMYRSKDEGRNTFHFYTEDMTTEAFARVVMEANLRTALDEDQFLVHYQPQFDLFSGELIGAEALVRWQHPELGFIGPDRFLPTAEESGLIVEIDQWVFENVCRQLALWCKTGIDLKGLRFAVNLSGRQLKHESLPQTFGQILDKTGCDPAYLELEITEGFIMHQPEVSTRILGQLKDLGMQLSIDDFGTGYSSLSYLKRLPINKLKIDRSFVQDIANDPNDAAISKSVIALGHSMNLKVVAEGIEDKEQEAFLKSEGCDMGQGYLYSKPVIGSELEVLLRREVVLGQAI